MRKRITVLTSLVLTFVLAIVGVFSINYSNSGNNQLVRNVVLSSEEIDYDAFFNEFDDSTLNVNESKNEVTFVGVKSYDKSMFDEVDFVSISPDDEEISIKYSFYYSADENKYLLSIIADVEDGVIVDNWEGTAFIADNNEVDIAFSTDDGVILLSDLEESGVLENCGWFSKLFKTVAKVAAVVAVVAVVTAVVVVAAPAVAAAATATTAVVSAGGAAALTGASAATAIAAASAAGTAAMATTAFALAATTAQVAVATTVTSYLASKTFEKLEDKVEAAVRELAKSKEFENDFMFRVGNLTNSNFTPKEKDISTGLSFFDSVPALFAAKLSFNKVCITTKSIVKNSGYFSLVTSGHHVGVFPTTGTMVDWIATRNNSVPDIRTTTLINCVIVVV